MIPKERQGSSRPDKDSDLHSFGQFGEQVPKHLRLTLPHKREVGREEPAGQVDVRPGLLQLSGDTGKSFRPVDQDFHLVTFSRRRVTPRPPASRRIECAFPIDPMQPPAVMAADRLRNTVREQALRRKQKTPCAWEVSFRGWLRGVQILR